MIVCLKYCTLTEINKYTFVKKIDFDESVKENRIVVKSHIDEVI